MNVTRRGFLWRMGVSLAGVEVAAAWVSQWALRAATASLPDRPLPATASPAQRSADTPKPNIILCMADDLGWGDTGYNGHPYLRTPNLDAMAAGGVVFERFYAGAPVCSPTRGSCLTGRHPFRYGIFSANVGHMPPAEMTLAELLRTAGYRTGHFGKWHLGTLTRDVRDSNRGGRPSQEQHYSPPWENGFDVCFSTEAKVPTWNPMVTPETTAGDLGGRSPSKPFGTYYWTGPGQRATENLQGDDSRVIMDRVIPFVEQAARENRPFLAVVWFHAPHLPVVAGPQYRAMYADLSEDQQHFYGCITAMDEQIGRLRATLRQLGIADRTIVWFCSDNGPEGPAPRGRTQGTTKGLRGRKRSLLEGGIRVPGLVEWPGHVPAGRVVTTPCCTSDYVPTVLDVLGLACDGCRDPRDGISLWPAIRGEMTQRPKPIGFEHGRQRALIDNRYKLYSSDGGRRYALYDVVADPGETRDLAAEEPQRAAQMQQMLEAWRADCRRSLAEHGLGRRA